MAGVIPQICSHTNITENGCDYNCFCDNNLTSCPALGETFVCEPKVLAAGYQIGSLKIYRANRLHFLRKTASKVYKFQEFVKICQHFNL